MAVFGLFDFNVPEKDCQEMASRLKTLKPEDLPSVLSNQFGSDCGKPRSPSVNIAIITECRGLREIA